jgi:hypothetical protein
LKKLLWLLFVLMVLLFSSTLVNSSGTGLIQVVKADEGGTQIGHHDITAIYQMAYIWDDHDSGLAGAGEWQFYLWAPSDASSGYATDEYSRDGPGYVDFTDLSNTWTITGDANPQFTVLAAEIDLTWDYTSTLYVPISLLDYSANALYSQSYKVGDVTHYYSFSFTNTHPIVGAISGPVIVNLADPEYSFVTSGSDSDGDSITYRWFIDGVQTGVTTSYFSSASLGAISLGQHTISVRTVDAVGDTSDTASSMMFEVIDVLDCLVVRGSNNGVYYRICDSKNNWGNWILLPGSTIDVPAAAVVNNELHIVVRGGSGGTTLYHGYIDLVANTFSGWTLISGSTPSTPTLTSNGVDLALVVRGSNNQIYHTEYTFPSRTWTSWSALPSGLTMETPAAVYVNYCLHVVVKGTDGKSLWYSSVYPSTSWFSGWSKLSGETPSSPTLTSDGNYLYLVVRGTDSRIYYRTYNTAALSWDDWRVIPSGTTPMSPAAAAAYYQHTLSIIVAGSDNNSIWQNNIDTISNTVSTWKSLNGSTPSRPTLTCYTVPSGFFY